MRRRQFPIVAVPAVVMLAQAFGVAGQSTPPTAATLPAQTAPVKQATIAAGAQTQQTTPNAQPLPAITGLETPWNVRGIVDTLIKDNEQFQPLLASLTPQQWVTKGASTAYIQQVQLAQRQVNDILITSKMLAQQTESLSLALDDYFRLEALEVTARSVQEGVRNYGERPAADKLSALIAHNFASRERFRDYVRNLAVSTEQNFKVADAEAQRCRGMISREPAPSSKKAKKY